MLEVLAFGHEQCRQLARIQKDLVAPGGQAALVVRRRCGPGPGARGAGEGAGRTEARRRRSPPTRSRTRRGRRRARSTRSCRPSARRRQAGAVGRGDFEELEKAEVRRLIVERGIRVDGRKVNEIRPISIEMAGICRAPTARRSSPAARPRPGRGHARGPSPTSRRSRPWRARPSGASCCTTTSRPSRSARSGGSASPSRRDIGHGALAERAVEAVLPGQGGVPVHDPHRLRHPRVQRLLVHGHGLRRLPGPDGRRRAAQGARGGHRHGPGEGGGQVGILTDIMGTEDHYGDMDFKVAGTEKGDHRAPDGHQDRRGVHRHHAGRRLQQAREARMVVLDKMREAIERPRPELSPYAPALRHHQDPPGKDPRDHRPRRQGHPRHPGADGAKIDVEDDGKVTVFSPDAASVQKAVGIIQDICREVELDRIYLGKVKKIMEFGAFVEVIPGTEGLLHISQIAESRIRAVGDVLTEGDEVLVKVIEIDGNGKMRLSPQDGPARAARAGRPGAAQAAPRGPPASDRVTEALPQERPAQRHPRPHRAHAPRALGGGRHVGGDRLAPRSPRTAAGSPTSSSTSSSRARPPASAEDIARAMDSVGGQMDAFTAKEHTCFYVQVLDEHLPLRRGPPHRHPAAPALRRRGAGAREVGRPPGDQDGGGHPRRPHPRPLRRAGLARHPLGRPILGTRERGDGVRARRHRSTTSARSTCRPRSSSPWPATSSTSPWSICSPARFDGFSRAPPDRAATRPPRHVRRRAHRGEAARAGARGDGFPRAAPRCPRSATRSSCSTTSSAAACPRGCSRRSASGRALVYSVHSGAQALPRHRAALRLRGHRPRELLQGAQVDPEGDCGR